MQRVIHLRQRTHLVRPLDHHTARSYPSDSASCAEEPFRLFGAQRRAARKKCQSAQALGDRAVYACTDGCGLSQAVGFEIAACKQQLCYRCQQLFQYSLVVAPPPWDCKSLLKSPVPWGKDTSGFGCPAHEALETSQLSVDGITPALPPPAAALTLRHNEDRTSALSCCRTSSFSVARACVEHGNGNTE